MANTVTITKLLEGGRDAYFQVYLKSDGVSGELNGTTIIDPAVDLSPTLTAGADLTIVEIWYGIIGFQALLEFDATTKQAAWLLTPSESNHISFDKFGGIKDKSTTGATGKILVQTTGFTAAGDEGSFIIKVRKN